MKKISFLIITVFCLINPVISGNIQVGTSSEYKTLRAALKVASSWDTITVNKGVYKEGELLIKKPLTIIGIDHPVFDGEEKNQPFTILSDSVTISGLKIVNIATSYVKERSAIKILKQKHCTIENNILENTFFGIYLEHSKYCIIRNNKILGNAKNEMSSGNAIHLWYSKYITVENNIAKRHRDGIYLEFVSNSDIKNNYVENNIRYGLHFMFSNHDNYIGNKFISNGAGVAVMFSKYIEMRHNIFSKNWGSSSYGLLLKEINDCTIHFNQFDNNTIGIYGEGANRINIKNNDFVHNGWALKILANCIDCKITRNNFLNNTFEVATNGSRNKNEYFENYWSQNVGYDLNNDGFSDVPYRPVKLFSYLIGRFQSSTILMRSLLINLINYAENIIPVITPANLIDSKPLMKRIDNDYNKGFK